MDDSNDYDYQASNPNETSSTIHGSPSEDESLNDNNDEDFILYHEIHDDDDEDEFVSSSDAELAPSPCDQLIEKSEVESFKIELDETKNETINTDCETKLPLHQRNKRSSGRLRKEGKVSMHAKNLFPGRPRIRMRKFTLNMNLNISDNTDKSTPSSTDIHEIDTVDQPDKVVSDINHQSPSQSILADSNELTSNNDPTIPDDTDHSETVENVEENVVVETRNPSKISVAKKKMNYSGKSKGKLAGRRNKTMEYRKKRGPKNKFKNFVSVSQAFPSTSDQTLSSSMTSDNDKQDDSNENKIILCSSNDTFVLSQDVCVMCGSLGKDDEGRLLSCAQCGQCCHPFCAGIKLTKIMFEKGWRCLECTVCEICGKPTDESRLLLCDDCDISYHTYCLDPPLEEVPQGTWKCQWCVVCVKCNNTSPGYGSHWQENYTCCGPCASQEKCSICKLSYDENDLIIQCNQCSRWLHSKCDSMFDENECEIASSIGYNCLNCRPKNEPPPHIQARKNGTLRSIFNKKRAEERNDPVLMKKNETSITQKDSTTDGQSDTINNENSVNSKLLSKYLVDGVYLSEAGLAMIKSQTLEPPKKQRIKRKNVKEELDESSNKEFEENGMAEENGDASKQQSEEEKKKRLRRLRLDKLGIGGFLIKQRGRLSFNKEDEEISQDCQERSITPDSGDSKPRRRRRINKKKNQLQDQYPTYLREAFFGKNLLDLTTANNTNCAQAKSGSDLAFSDNDESEKEEDDEQKTIGMDKIVDLKMELVQSIKPKNNNDELNFLVESLSSDVLNVFSPDAYFLNMIINEDAPNDDEVLNELDVESGNNKNGTEESNDDADGKIVMDDIFNLNEYNDTDSGLPQMDSKDVEDLFEVMSSSSSISVAAPPPQPLPPQQQPVVQQPPQPPPPQQIIPKEYHHQTGQNSNLVMVQQQQPPPPPQKPNVEPLNIPLMVAKHSPMSDTTPTSVVTPLSGESLCNLQQRFSTFNSNPPVQNPYKIASKPQPEHVNPSEYYMNPTPEQDSEATTQLQKNLIKCESEEALGQYATISAVLYSNINHPELRSEYPVFADRFKQIHKIWRQLSSDQRAPYLQMARDNRSQSKKNQAEMSQKNLNKNKLDGSEKQWKDGSNNLLQAQSMSSQSGEHGGGGGFPPMSSEYAHGPNNNNRFPSTPMGGGIQHSASMAQLSPNPMMMQPSPQAMAAHSPHHSMSPALHSPRLRPYVDSNAYAQQPPLSPAMAQHGQMNMIRPSNMVIPNQQGSFSPNSPNLNAVHPIAANADWNQSSPGTPQRSQSAEMQPHSYGGGGGGPLTPSPYGPTGPSCQKSFSPNQHHQLPLGGNAPTNDSYHSPNMENYKAKMNVPQQQQHQISKPHTPDAATYIPSMAGPPGTPQPSQSPQSQVPQSPINEMYARSPSAAPARPIPTSQAMVRQTSFEDNNNGYNNPRQQPPSASEMYSTNTTLAVTTGTGSGYSPQFMQQNTVQSYNMPSDGFGGQDVKVAIRPNMVNNVPNRPNVPIRRTISDPYARQPLSSGGGVGGDGFAKIEDNQQDPHSKQHLRNLLQVQQIRRHDSPAGTSTNNPQMWQDNANNNNNNFRQPISPALTNRIRVPMQQSPSHQQGFPMEPGFRFPPGNDQQHRMMMHPRNPQNSGDMRFRQMVPQQQQPGIFEVRFQQQQQHPQQQQPINPQRMLVKQQGPVARLQPPIPHQQQQQQPNWPVTGSPNVNLHPNQMMVQNNMVFQQQQLSNNSNKMSAQQSPAHKTEMTNIKMENETIKMPMANDIIQTEDVEEPLPVELCDDDELLKLAADFNILEYADPELDSKTVIGGHTGKSNIFDEIEMLSEKEKDGDSEKNNSKSNTQVNKPELVTNVGVNKASSNEQLYQQMNYGNNNPNDPNRIYGNKTTVGPTEVDPNSQTPIKHDQQEYFQNISNPDCFMSDDDFERLKNDCLNDSEQINSGNGGGGEMPSPNQMNSYSMAPVQQQQSGPHIPPSPGGGLISPQPPSMAGNQQQSSTPPHQSHQIYMQNCQYNPTMNPGQAWGNRMNFQNRMNPRMPMNQPQVMNRHVPPGAMYPQSGGGGNRIVMQQNAGGGGGGHLPITPNPSMMSRPNTAMINEQNQCQNDPYDMQQQQNANLLLQKQKHLESEVGKLRKIKKSLNAKQRQCRKNQNELSEQDANELARITQELINLQKQLDQVKKLIRQNRVLQERNKAGQNINLPHSPSTQTSPRSVNSPLAVLNTSGPGTPLGICPSTPQSPSLTCPSPSSLIQNSPKSSLHSPASMMPPSPMPNNSEMAVGTPVRPQIVQEDNNPFSDVYLQNEKKQTMQQSNMYSAHPPMTKEINPILDTRQQSMYANNFDEMAGPPQQYYHGQPMQQSVPYQNMRPQTSMNFPENNYRFPNAGGMNPHFVGPQQQPSQMNYQQMRRPPPPPYPKTPQNFGPRGPYPPPPPPPPPQSSSNPAQVRMQPQMRNSLDCNMNPGQIQSHPIYQDANSPMMQPNDPGFNLNSMDQMPIVGEAETTMEFNISEPGNGVDNESDPFTFLKEMANQQENKLPDQNQPSGSNNENVSTLSTSNDGQQSTSIEDHQERNLNHATSNANSSNSEDHPDLSNLNVPKLKNGDQGETRQTQECGSDNSEDDGGKMENSNIKPNALLKQLLQNCPSADLNQGHSASSIDVASNVVDEQKETEVSTIIDEPNHAVENIAVITDQEQTSMVSGVNESNNNSNNNDDDEHGTLNTSTTSESVATTTTTTSTIISSDNIETPPIVEKKLSYLDIRRAQLEKEPTPPLEDIKPKRKRTVKRKESNKSLDGGCSGGGDSMDSNHHMNNTNTNIIKQKKRTRKGSQTKVEQQDGNNSGMDSIGNNHEKMLATIIKHIGTLPAIQIVEPEVKINLNVCLPSDARDFNVKKPKLKGCYGNAFLSSAIDYYTTYPFGPNKPTNMVVSAANNNSGTTSSNKVGYYNDEFGRSIMDWKEHPKERDMKLVTTNSLYCRDVDSPETIISASSPECDLYDQPKDMYNKMKFINDDDDDIKSEDEDRKSPFLTFLPLHRPMPMYSSPKDMMENNKENCVGNQKTKFFRQNHSATPLKESGNVEITIMVTPGRDVRYIMERLAKLLNLRSSLTYNIIKSPNGTQTTDTLEIYKEDDNIYCKACNNLIKDQGYKASDNGQLDISMDDDEDSSFCNKECFKNYCLTTVNASMKKEFIDDEMNLDALDEENCGANDLVENEIASIFNNSNKNDQSSEDLESVISIHEKHWKNTKYLYWNVNAFKNENKIQTVEEEPVEALLDRLDICLKANKNCQERRRCLFCHDLGDGQKDGPSRLLNMDVGKWVHLNCALWSNEVYEMCNGALMNVDLAYNRAMNSGCVSCSKFGASIKCFKLRCNNSYHFPCAIREKCVFYTDKTLLCPIHCSKSSSLLNAKEMSSFVVDRKVYINRDEQKQIAAMLHQGEHNLMRIGSLIFLNIGQLLPHQLQNFHTNSYIYPIGYKVCRFYWSSRKLGKRCQYVCSIDELNNRPQFYIEVKEDGYENVTYRADTPKLAWEKIIESIVKLREESKTIKVFFDFISGEDLFGLNEPAIIRILESLPGVDTLYDYNFKYGRSPWYELPLAINPSGCARTEPKKRFHSKRPHTLHVSSNTTRSSLQSPLTNPESSSPYVKQFVHSKVSQYRKMKQEWRNNVYLGRSRIQGLGLYASRDIEKHTMIIEYIGSVIRNAIADRNERIHEAHNRGIYMFRLDDNRVIDATLAGGLARYVNHSCDPNCVAESVQIDRENKILIIANRRIQKGEELTYDYKFDVEDDQHKIPCLCGAKNCRKWMN